MVVCLGLLSQDSSVSIRDTKHLKQSFLFSFCFFQTKGCCFYYTLPRHSVNNFNKTIWSKVDFLHSKTRSKQAYLNQTIQNMHNCSVWVSFSSNRQTDNTQTKDETMKFNLGHLSFIFLLSKKALDKYYNCMILVSYTASHLSNAFFICQLQVIITSM